MNGTDVAELFTATAALAALSSRPLIDRVRSVPRARRAEEGIPTAVSRETSRIDPLLLLGG